MVVGHLLGRTMMPPSRCFCMFIIKRIGSSDFTNKHAHQYPCNVADAVLLHKVGVGLESLITVVSCQNTTPATILKIEQT